MFYPVAAGKQQIVKDGLVLWLDANDRTSYPGFGNTWRDLTPGDNNGILTNGPTFDSGNGGSIVFDGTDDYVPTSFRINTNDFTEEVWVYTPNSFQNENQISAQYVGGNSGRYILSLNNNVGIKVRYFLGGTKGYSNQIITTNSWYQIVIIRENSTGYIFINGVLDQTVGAGTSTIASTPYYTLGQLSAIDNNYSWNGKIASTKIYNRALSADEILQNYNATKDRFGL